MNRERQLRQFWFDAHQALRIYLEKWTSIEVARALASHACAIWMQHAADGLVEKVGPYVGLHKAAYAVLSPLSMTYDVPTWEDAQRAIADSGTLLPYQAAKVYVDVWRAAQLLSWDRKTIHRASKGLSVVFPSGPTGWLPLGQADLGRLVPPLARRAVEVLETHRCLDCQICAESALRWEDADIATEQWFTARRLEREEAACPMEERSPSQ